MFGTLVNNSFSKEVLISKILKITLGICMKRFELGCFVLSCSACVDKKICHIPPETVRENTSTKDPWMQTVDNPRQIFAIYCELCTCPTFVSGFGNHSIDNWELDFLWTVLGGVLHIAYDTFFVDKEQLLSWLEFWGCCFGFLFVCFIFVQMNIWVKCYWIRVIRHIQYLGNDKLKRCF